MSRTQRWRRVLAVSLVGALASVFAVAAPAWAQTDSDATALMEQKVEPELLAEIAGEGEAELWVQFHGGPDYSAALNAETKADKGAAAVEAAMDFAESSQADLTTALGQAGVEYESYWASSAVKVTGGIGLLETIAAFDQVAAIVDSPEVVPVEPVESAFEPTSTAWGVEDVNAPSVWEQLGVTGEGVVVASIDSGVQYDHPALVEQYRGNNGDGTFTHDYNFYDVEGICGGTPCDISNSGHGTHTVGTMVGDDGAGNQIGVAPGAEWIAVNYYGASMESVLKAGQWIAAPTDSEGNDPDPSKAPDIVNNSWGRDTTGDDDPYYQDIVNLWHAAGIIPVFAAGNSGPECATGIPPGAYANVIAVGAYDSSGEIAEGSSRGPTSDGRGKPDVSAPGVRIYSSMPGGTYDLMSGTSMAAPHVTGTIALMMEAEPALRGDYGLVYEMLTDSARFTEDDQCGGTDEANNVHGHGRIDAFAGAQALPEGESGSITGTVTDTDGTPLEGAELVFDGAFDRRATTGADGTYTVSFALAGQHAVSVTKFGYEPAAGTVTVAADQTVEFDATLTPLETTVVTGTVVDGSGHGWPLAATVATAGGEVSTTTDPLTGQFELTLPIGGVELVVEADYGGYQTVRVAADATDLLIEVPVANGCTAPGYAYDPLGTGFESETAPVGWTVVNRGSEPWTFEDPFGTGNRTPGSGGFAFADPVGGGVMDTDLVSPVFDLASAPEPVLFFATDFYMYAPHSRADVAISVDGGQSWEEVWAAEESVRDTTVTVDLTAWAGAQEAQLKFHYYHAYRSTYWWQVDDVLVGGVADCAPIAGGLVRGTVTDQSGAPVAGAQVTHTGSGHHGTSDADGQYWTFAPGSGLAQLEAVDDESGSATVEVDIVPDSVVEANFVLGTPPPTSFTPTGQELSWPDSDLVLARQTPRYTS
ncbi:S8 family serine peptidase [Glycomyces tenuis]|uniref:S8 family serine peptidase n=4 Tax=Glycomyces tenuis TaxID=58116 RepID=UPI0004255AEB|nr:S8 family serine peptidase [Glycomyces tenuis]